MASCIFSNQSQWLLTIPKTHSHQGVVYYDIFVKIGSVQWTVRRRYSEFSRLNSTLVKEQGIDRDLLPPKRFVGNKNPDFIEERRAQLQVYLNNVFQHLVKTMPTELVSFLKFEDHDVMFIIRKIPQTLALSVCGAAPPELSVLQVHSLCARLKLPCPPSEMSGYQHDFCSILEACNRLDALQVKGNSVTHSSNDRQLFIDFIIFKSLRHLFLDNVLPELMINADSLRNTLSRLSWVQSQLTSLDDALMCDMVHKNFIENKVWKLKRADFSHNSVKVIGDTVGLIPDLVSLNVSDNKIECLRGLNTARKLGKLNLCDNGIMCFENLRLDPCSCVNLTWMNLGDNKMQSLRGLESFKTLRFLDLSNNLISDFKEIKCICSLPHLTCLILQGNPLSFICDYRVKVLELFDDRVSFVSLDNELPSQRELDRIAVLQALRIVKEGRSPL